jgi:hypothetical protein
MMPRSRSNDEVIARRRTAVNARTSTTNWSDRFFSTGDYSEILQADDLGKYQLPSVPQLTEHQLAIVG